MYTPSRSHHSPHTEPTGGSSPLPPLWAWLTFQSSLSHGSGRRLTWERGKTWVCRDQIHPKQPGGGRPRGVGSVGTVGFERRRRRGGVTWEGGRMEGQLLKHRRANNRICTSFTNARLPSCCSSGKSSSNIHHLLLNNSFFLSKHDVNFAGLQQPKLTMTQNRKKIISKTK